MDDIIRKKFEQEYPDVKFDAISDILIDLADVIKECVMAIKNLAVNLFGSIFKSVIGNGRVVYLALHAKKARTRKKNMNRIIKTALREIERTMKIDEKDSDEGN